jgi:fructose-1,6-bisphosphatase-3
MSENYELKYLELLSKEFPSVQEVSTELINLTAILNLPKGTEHFLSDIHGEYDTFNHFIKNGSGVTKDKINILFSDKSEAEKNTLSFFVYYPKQMIIKYENILSPLEFNDFTRKMLLDLISLASFLSKKYTKSKVIKTLPTMFSYIIQELLYENRKHEDKELYYTAIIDAIYQTKREKNFLIELSYFIQRLTIDKLHIVGDIFDRGPSAHLVMNKIQKYHSVDIEWGNHDIIWMGAASGSKVAICNVLRNSAKYNTLDTLEEGYGINLLPLSRLAEKYYGDDPCEVFMPRTLNSGPDEDDELLVAKMHKAIAIIQFKLEKSLIDRNPQFELEDRLLLDKIDYKKGIIVINNKTYTLKDTNFPTIDPLNPYVLTDEEDALLDQLKNAFLNNDLLQNHMEYLFHIGQLYLKYNNNLLFHGCIPLEGDGTLSNITVDNITYKGKALFDFLDKTVRMGYLNRYNVINYEKDYFIFLWQGKNSPLFGKKAMKTFERYFIKEKVTHYEEKNDYFTLRENVNILKNLYNEFEIDFNKSKIINGHVPTDITNGDNPIKANGRIYAIDGGMSKQYSNKISIGGYTLVSDSYSMFLISHDRFESKESLIESEKDIISLVRAEDINKDREFMYNTDKGEKIQDEIKNLYKLLDSYRSGLIKEKIKRKNR